MHLLNLSVQRIIIHQIFQRDIEGKRKQPVQGHEYVRFSQEALAAFISRVKDAIGEGTRCVQMEIVNQGPNDIPVMIDRMISQNDEDFAASSFDIAAKLADVQQTRTIPGGIIVIFTGTQGVSKTRYLGVIKADIHTGYEKYQDPKTNEISLKYVEELLLTPSTRLYKTAAFFEKAAANSDTENLNEKWTVIVSDYQISNVDGKAAAKYFYRDFLGCGYPNTSARTTKMFYDSTRQFILGSEYPSEKKSDLINALVSYLKVENSTSISASDFSARYFDDIDIQDTYGSHMKESGIPDTAFTKDLEHIESSLKLRRVNFRSKVKITAPAEAFKNLVTIKTIDGQLDESGSPAIWTKVIIKDRIIDQE